MVEARFTIAELGDRAVKLRDVARELTDNGERDLATALFEVAGALEDRARATIRAEAERRRT